MSEELLPPVDDSLKKVQTFTEGLDSFMEKVVEMTSLWLVATKNPGASGYRVIIEACQGNFRDSDEVPINVSHFRLIHDSKVTVQRLFGPAERIKSIPLIDCYFYIRDGEYNLFRNSNYPSQVYIEEIAYIRDYMDYLRGKVEEMKFILDEV